MAVANEKIIRKMINELQQALETETNQQKMIQHISNVKLLCELIVEDESPGENRTKISTEEMKAMIGEAGQTKGKVIRSVDVDHDDANGDSILDF
ncbi:hypothetical protein JOC34_003593 [Virgibacillus halotolerans]|uniref:YwdI family protein n=1 Tax=Virgibacillus halotolerans TaxID=1071053 RepID=UPI00195FC09E|nr:YwdI family protein [Virgibacillus halotolerans]MBM7601172.1 hypothetical protein [Virgibacillus halotolerans]